MRVANNSTRKCPFCGVVPEGFRDLLSAKEYVISGLCQDCQDETFVEMEDQDD